MTNPPRPRSPRVLSETFSKTPSKTPKTSQNLSGLLPLFCCPFKLLRSCPSKKEFSTLPISVICAGSQNCAGTDIVSEAPFFDFLFLTFCFFFYQVQTQGLKAGRRGHPANGRIEICQRVAVATYRLSSCISCNFKVDLWAFGHQKPFVETDPSNGSP